MNVRLCSPGRRNFLTTLVPIHRYQRFFDLPTFVLLTFAQKFLFHQFFAYKFCEVLICSKTIYFCFISAWFDSPPKKFQSK
jgi:hypothetical protein